LEKFEMKKTLVAIAAAAAVTGVYAEVTISGFVDLAVMSTSSTSSVGAKTTANTVGTSGTGQDALNFGITEDLGNGLTAFADMNYVVATGTNASTPSQDSGSGIGLKSASMGKIFLGNSYNQIWFTMNMADASGWGAGKMGSVWAATNGAAGSVENNSNAIVYTLPTLTEGLDIIVEGRYGNTSTGTADSTGAGIAYTNGALSAKYAYNKKNLSTASSTTYAVSSTSTSVVSSTSYTSAFSTYDALSAATAGSSDGATSLVTQAIALTYDFGVAKAFYGNQTQVGNNGSGIAENKYTYGITVPFGATTIGYAHSSAEFTNAGDTTTKISGDKIIARYALSKRTNVYASYGKTATDGATTSLSNTSLGLFHSF